MNYFETLNEEVREYFKILSPEFPEWLFDYINTSELKRIGKISMSCGTDYSKCFDVRYFYSNLDHSVAVALIIWNFTHDKKQTIAGLLHDIATPVFKHCIDFMNGDSEHQESTEERTSYIIRNSKELINLFKRDNISISEIEDYHIYPIADNDSPKLSADRFEYNFSSGLTFFRVWDLDKIKKVYNNIIIVKNEENTNELCFKDKDICEEYIRIVSKLWPEWISYKDKIVMQFLADMCKSMNVKGYLSIDDLYTLSEKEVIDKIINCEDSYLSQKFIQFMNTSNVYNSKIMLDDKYCINIKTKIRYLNPLVLDNGKVFRISDISKEVNNIINNHLNINNDLYTYFDFDFKPYKVLAKKI